MKRKRYSEEEIISILKEHEAGASVPDLSRRYGIAENTIYCWKSKYGGMEVSETRRLRELEAEPGAHHDREVREITEGYQELARKLRSLRLKEEIRIDGTRED